MESSEENNSKDTFKDSPLPQKSKEIYMVAYECFMSWKNKRNKVGFNEAVFYSYFTELAKIKKPSTLWAQYSMLKATMRLKHQVHLQYYRKVLKLLKRYTIGYKAQQSKILTENNILQFINEAPDHKYLATKVALIIGVGGACKSSELIDVTVNNIETHGEIMLVRIHPPDKGFRTFIVRDEFVPIVKKYQGLRPKDMPTERFFINYRDQQCTRQVIGNKKMSALPKQIASYLKLPNPERYTGHCFRRSAYACKSNTVCRARHVLDLRAHSLVNTPHGGDKNGPIFQIEGLNNKVVDNKVEAMNDFDEDPFLTNEFDHPMEADNDIRTSQGCAPDGRQGSDIIDSSDDFNVNMDDVQIINEEVETIDLTTIEEKKTLPEEETQEKNIIVDGNNIRIFFQNCAHVVNITVKMNSK